MILLSLFIAFLALIVLNFQELQHGFILSWASLLIFAVMIIGIGYFHFSLFTQYPFSLASGTLSLLLFLSIIFRHPFTLQYIQASLPLSFLKNPLFFKMNQTLSLVWAASIGLFFLGSLVFPLVDIVAFLLVPLLITHILPAQILGRHFWREVKGLPPLSSPYLEDNFAPTLEKRHDTDLEVEGMIPLELNGIYMRNGPNPQFAPYTYTYPFDGDAMIHAIYLEHGWVQYQNNFVETEDFLLEKKAGKALFGGLALPLSPDPRYVGESKWGHVLKQNPSAHIIPWKNHWLALAYGQPAYLVDDHLHTQSQWQPENKKGAFSFQASFKTDPETHEKFCSSFDAHALTHFALHQFDKEGSYLREIPVYHASEKRTSDFLLTQNFILILGEKIALIRRENLEARPVEAKLQGLAYLEAHAEKKPKKVGSKKRPEPLSLSYPSLDSGITPINAFELGEHLKFHYLSEEGGLYEGTLDLTDLSLHETLLYQGQIAFPIYREDRSTHSYRYLYFLEKVQAKKVGVFDALVRFDLLTHKQEYFNLPKHWELSEAVFVPDETQSTEDLGYLLLFAYDRVVKKSGFIILDAHHPEAKPIAIIKLPCRVPHGLHGCWKPHALRKSA